LVASLLALGLAVAAATIVAAVRHSAAKPAAAPRPVPPPRLHTRTRPPSRAAVLVLEQQRAITRLSGLGVPVFCGAARGRDVALTFDDGPGPYTSRVLAILRRDHARAPFFLVGNRIHFWPRLPAAEASLGVVGDHTWSHADLARLPRRTARSEINRPLAALHGRIRLFRTPYGRDPAWLGRYLAARGMLEIRWSVDSSDYLPRSTAAATVRRVAPSLHAGAIVLLHDIHPATVRALPRLLAMIRARHLRAVTLPELLRTDAPTYGQLIADNRGRGCVDLATARHE